VSGLIKKWPRITGVRQVVLTTIIVSSLLIGVVGYALPAIAQANYGSDSIPGGNEAYLAEGLPSNPTSIPNAQANRPFWLRPNKPFIGPGQGQPFGFVPNRPGNPWKLRRDRGVRLRGIIKAIEENKIALRTRFGVVLIGVTSETKVVEVRKGLEPVGVQVGQRAIVHLVPGERIPKARLLIVFAMERRSTDSRF
jgi:hypothetical protein